MKSVLMSVKPRPLRYGKQSQNSNHRLSVIFTVRKTVLVYTVAVNVI